MGAQHRRRHDARSIFGALILLPFLGLATGHLHEYHPLRTSVPAFSLYNLNILGKLGFGALGGFEYVAILAGETRSPARSVGRSVLIAAPIIALMFVLGTRTVVAYIPTDQIDLIGPLPQVLRVGFGPFGIAGQLVTIAILMTLGMRVAQTSVSFTAVDAPADGRRLGPPAAAVVQPAAREVRTPVNSIVLVGLASFVIAVLEPHRRRAGRGVSAAVQRERNVLRADVRRDVRDSDLVGLRGITPRPPLWLRVASMSGLLMTVLYVVLSVFPIIEVESVATFAFKISLVIVVANASASGCMSPPDRARRVSRSRRRKLSTGATTSKLLTAEDAEDAEDSPDRRAARSRNEPGCFVRAAREASIADVEYYAVRVASRAAVAKNPVPCGSSPTRVQSSASPASLRLCVEAVAVPVVRIALRDRQRQRTEVNLDSADLTEMLRLPTSPAPCTSRYTRRPCTRTRRPLRVSR